MRGILAVFVFAGLAAAQVSSIPGGGGSTGPVTGCASSGTNVIQKGDGSGGCIPSGLTDTGTAITTTETIQGITPTVFGRLDPTSSVQTQLNAKEPTITTLPTSKGGTGAGALTGIRKANGASADTAAVAGTDYDAAGAATAAQAAAIAASVQKTGLAANTCLPVIYTASGSITQYQTVVLNTTGTVQTSATGGGPIFGVAQSTVTTGNTVGVCSEGVSNVLMDGTVVQGNIAITSVTTGGRGHDSGLTTRNSIGIQVGIVGGVMTGCTGAGCTAVVALEGSNRGGRQILAAYVPALKPIYTLWGFGDSFMYGVGATDPSRQSAFALIANAIPGVAQANDAGVGGYTADSVNFSAHQTFGPSPTSASVSMLDDGANDGVACGTTNCVKNYTETMMATEAWLTIPNTYRQMASTATQGGVWTADTSYTIGSNATSYIASQGTPMSSTASGATLTFSIPSSASPIVGVSFLVTNSQLGTFTISIDGSLRTDSCSGTTTFSSGPCVVNLPTRTSTIFRQEWSVTANQTHTVVITLTAAVKSSIVSVDWIPPASEPATNAVFVWGTNAGYLNYTLYNAASSSVAATLKADGLPVFYVDMQSGTPGVNATTDLATVATQTCDASTFANHPNALCGYLHLAQTVYAAEIANNYVFTGAIDNGLPSTAYTFGGLVSSSTYTAAPSATVGGITQLTNNVNGSGSGATQYNQLNHIIAAQRDTVNDFYQSTTRYGAAYNRSLGGVQFPYEVGSYGHITSAGSITDSNFFIYDYKNSKSLMTSTGGVVAFPNQVELYGNIFHIGLSSFGGFTDDGYQVLVQKSRTTGTAHFQDQTATTGFTRVVVDKGAADTAATSIFTVNGLETAAAHGTTSNCSSSAAPAVCGSAAAGSVTMAVSGTTKVVNTTAVTANSQILLTYDSSLGTKLGVTCGTTTATLSVSARTAGTSFTITMSAAAATNPTCISYTIVN